MSAAFEQMDAAEVVVEGTLAVFVIDEVDCILTW